MYPNIILGSIVVSGWYLMLVAGVIISTALAAYLVPKDFPLTRREVLLAAALVVVSGMLGGRVLYLILHYDISSIRVGDLFSITGGFAYFGALVFAVLALWIYALLREIQFLGLADYSIAFLMLSQAFVRIGCFLAGCCCGKVTGFPLGMVFRSVDSYSRHPTQIYEAVLLLAIYSTSRFLYGRKRGAAGYTFFITLTMYGAGRFFIEFLRTDSPVLFLKMTLAQISCLSLALFALLTHIYRYKRL